MTLNDGYVARKGQIAYYTGLKAVKIFYPLENILLPVDYTYVPYKYLCQILVCFWISAPRFDVLTEHTPTVSLVSELVQVVAVEEEMYQMYRTLGGNSSSYDHRGWQKKIEFSQTNES